MSLYTPLSFWEKDVWFTDLDVVIIGGGIVGMNAALRIKEKDPKCKVLILERSAVGTAASSRNAGFSCYGSPSELVDDLEHSSEDEVFNLVEMRVKGLYLLQTILGRDAIAYEPTGGYEMFLSGENFSKHCDLLPQLNNALRNIAPDLSFYISDKKQGLHNVEGIIANNWEGQIHPGKMTAQLAHLCDQKGIIQIRGLNVDQLNDNGLNVELTCKNHVFEAKKVIISNNAFAQQLIKDEVTQPGRNMVLLTGEIPNIKVKGCYHFDKGYVYFRNVGKRLLIGGGRNIDKVQETTNQFGSNTKVKTYLIDIVNKHILPKDEYAIEHEWSGILGFNHSKKPRVEKIKPNVYTAVGLGGMGVAIGTLIGRQVAELLWQS